MPGHTRSLSRTAAAAALLASLTLAQNPPQLVPSQRLLPVTAPLVELEGTLDLGSGRFALSRTPTIGGDGKVEVYDNTCASGAYLGLQPAGNPGTGSAHPELVGDFGAIPSTLFNAGMGMGDAFCTVGCEDAYDITQFEIAWCQLAAPITGAVIELDFWDIPQQSCVLGTAPGNNPTGGQRPPATSPVFSATLAGLPRNSVLGTLACYVLNVTLVTPGFNLQGSTSFSPGVTAGDKFAWGFAMPTSTGADGPLLAGDVDPGTVCTPCEGTVFEQGGATTNDGTGAGQDGTFFWEDYGGTSVPMGSGDCYAFGGPTPPSGLHLELFAFFEVDLDLSTFCDGADGSLASCPCAPGNPDSGCDTPIPAMQGGGTTGGVELTPIAQQFTPANRATLRATGFPSGSTPGGVVFRNRSIDPSSPAVFGDGLRCVDATADPTSFARIGASIASGGVMECTFGHGPGAMAGPGTFYYQLWFRSTPASYCDPTAAFNTSNGVILDWF